MTRLTNVLKAKQISISQLCDEDLHVHFAKRRCYVLKEGKECVLTRIRTSNNCYQMNEIIYSINMNVQMHDMMAQEIWTCSLQHVQIGDITSTQVLELMHIDLFRTTQIESVGCKKYALVCVDDYSRYTWIDLLINKSDAFGAFKKKCLNIQTQKGSTLRRLRSDHGKEFESNLF